MPSALIAATWWSEVLTVALTALYVAIVVHDLRVVDNDEASGKRQYSSVAWFSAGFCIEQHPGLRVGVTSHTLCFVADLVIGGALLATNWHWYRSSAARSLFPVGVSLFTIMHGFGHFLISSLDQDFMESVRPSRLPWLTLLGYYMCTVAFLGIGPWLGVVNGAPLWPCVALHLSMGWAILAYLPTQLAFGAVLIVVNLWYCVPRLLLIGCDDSEGGGAAQRSQNSWAAISLMLPFLMPVVFAEMLWCEAVLRPLGGHLLYDLSTDLAAVVYSVVLWRSADSPSVRASASKED